MIPSLSKQNKNYFDALMKKNLFLKHFSPLSDKQLLHFNPKMY